MSAYWGAPRRTAPRRRSSLHQQQRDGPDRSQRAKRGPQRDRPNRSAGQKPAELLSQEHQFIEDRREIVAGLVGLAVRRCSGSSD